MTQRIPSVLVHRGFALAGLALVGCAADATQPEAPEFAQDYEVAVKFQALTVVECNEQAAQCLIDNPLRPLSCSLKLTDCLATTAVEETVDLAECTLEDVGCTIEAGVELACGEVVDCQREVTRCVSDTVNDVTGVDVDPILDESDPYVKEVGETCDEAIDLAGDVVEVGVDTVEDAVNNALDELACAEQARQCVRDNPFQWLSCQVDFAACTAEVAANTVEDAVETVEDTTQIVGDVVEEAEENVDQTIDCALQYRQCREDGRGFFDCSREARDCELYAL